MTPHAADKNTMIEDEKKYEQTTMNKKEKEVSSDPHPNDVDNDSDDSRLRTLAGTSSWRYYRRSRRMIKRSSQREFSKNIFKEEESGDESATHQSKNSKRKSDPSLILPTEITIDSEDEDNGAAALSTPKNATKATAAEDFTTPRDINYHCKPIVSDNDDDHVEEEVDETGFIRRIFGKKNNHLVAERKKVSFPIIKRPTRPQMYKTSSNSSGNSLLNGALKHHHSTPQSPKREDEKKGSPSDDENEGEKQKNEELNAASNFIRSEIELLENILDKQEDEIDELGDDLTQSLRSTKSKKDLVSNLNRSCRKLEKKNSFLEIEISEAKEDEKEMNKILRKVIMERDETMCDIRNDINRVTNQIKMLERDIDKKKRLLDRTEKSLDLIEGLCPIDDLIQVFNSDDDSSILFADDESSTPSTL